MSRHRPPHAYCQTHPLIYCKANPFYGKLNFVVNVDGSFEGFFINSDFEECYCEGPDERLSHCSTPCFKGFSTRFIRFGWPRRGQNKRKLLGFKLQHSSGFVGRHRRVHRIWATTVGLSPESKSSHVASYVWHGSLAVGIVGGSHTLRGRGCNCWNKHLCFQSLKPFQLLSSFIFGVGKSVRLWKNMVNQCKEL